jgi:Uma2 family endonuclease
MSVGEQTQLLTLDEFSRLYDQEGAFELIEGERRPLAPNVAIHGWIVRALFLLLYNHCAPAQLGQVFTELPYVLVYDSTWVKGSRVPDLMFFTSARWQQYVQEVPDWQSKPFIIVPDLAVEVVSPNDLYTEIQDKVDRWLSDGVRLVWVVDPQRSRVNVYESTRFTTLSRDGTLDGGDVIPGLNLKLETLFTPASEKAIISAEHTSLQPSTRSRMS